MSDAAFAEPRRRGRPPRVRIEGREDPEFDPAFRAADESLDEVEPDVEPEIAVTPPPTTESVAPTIPDGWLDMAEAPQDGKAIWVIGEAGEYVESIWRHTRVWDKMGGKWRTSGWWAVMNTGGQRVAFEPIAWKAR